LQSSPGFLPRLSTGSQPHPTVNRRLGKRVWKAVGQLGYSPNAQARGLVSGKNRLPRTRRFPYEWSFSPEIIQSFEAHAGQRGYEILVTSLCMIQAHRAVRAPNDRTQNRGVAVLTFGSELLVEILRAQGFRWYMGCGTLCFQGERSSD